MTERRFAIGILAVGAIGATIKLTDATSAFCVLLIAAVFFSAGIINSRLRKKWDKELQNIIKACKKEVI